jgi:hypothetical protein
MAVKKSVITACEPLARPSSHAVSVLATKISQSQHLLRKPGFPKWPLQVEYQQKVMS